MGLTALMLLQHARQAARHDAAGEIVLLEDQDRSLWKRGMITEGLALGRQGGAASPARSLPGRRAAIRRTATQRAGRAEDTDWAQIDSSLHGAGAHAAFAGCHALTARWAVAKAHGAQAALELVDPLADRLRSYFHFHGVRGWLLKQLGRKAEARDGLFDRAISLAGSAAEANQIRLQLDQLERDAADRQDAKRA